MLDERVVPRQSHGIVALGHENIPAVANVGNLIVASKCVLRGEVVRNVQTIIVALKQNRGVNVALVVADTSQNPKAAAGGNALVVNHAPMNLYHLILLLAPQRDIVVV